MITCNIQTNMIQQVQQAAKLGKTFSISFERNISVIDGNRLNSYKIGDFEQVVCDKAYFEFRVGYRTESNATKMLARMAAAGFAVTVYGRSELDNFVSFNGIAVKS